MLTRATSYGSLVDGFAWDLPDRLNMAAQVCDDWAAREPERSAIIDLSGARRDVSYGDLRRMADSLAHHLVAQGVAPGDRVGVLRSQSAWCAAAHIAIWKIGAISIPLFKLFAREALLSRVKDAQARVIVTDPEGAAMLDGQEAVFPEDLTLADTPFETADTTPETPAVLIYTSGTTGSPKGALHGHRVLTGHLPGTELFCGFPGQEGDLSLIHI